MTWTGRPTNWGKPGHVNRGDEYEAVLDQISSLTSPGYTAFTPTWTNTSTQPAIGNGSWNGTRYWRPDGADRVEFEILLTWGTTTTGGTGSFWSIGFPTSPAPGAIDLAGWHGTAFGIDTSVPARRGLFGVVLSGVIVVQQADGTLVRHDSPWTWASGDTLSIKGSYEPA